MLHHTLHKNSHCLMPLFHIVCSAFVPRAFSVGGCSEPLVVTIDQRSRQWLQPTNHCATVGGIGATIAVATEAVTIDDNTVANDRNSPAAAGDTHTTVGIQCYP